MTSPESQSDQDHERPEFMVRLGLLPPYSEEDVKQAYLEKVKAAQADVSTDVDVLQELQETFELALEYVRFRKDRRSWIASQVDAYAAAQGALALLREQYGAEVETEGSDWMTASFGDFAQLSEKVIGIRLVDSPSADQMIDDMVREQPALRYLQRLELPGCTVSDASVLHLRVFTCLHHLDLSRTPITPQALELVPVLPSLDSIELQGTSVSSWARWRLQPKLRERKKKRDATQSLSVAVRDRMRRRRS